MYARIVDGVVAQLTAEPPALGDWECAHVVQVFDWDVRVGWIWTPEGCTAPPDVVEPGPDPVTVAHSYLLADAQTVGALRNALVEILGL